MIGVEGMGLKL